MTYCTNSYYGIGGRFNPGTIITQVKIPPSCGNLLLFVFKKVSEYNGLIWDNPYLGSDGTVLLGTVTFTDDIKRSKCCEEINQKIETMLKQQKAISVLIDFIDNNGGWFDSETGKLLGFNELEKAFRENLLDEDTESILQDAIFVSSELMRSYLIGYSKCDADEN